MNKLCTGEIYTADSVAAGQSTNGMYEGIRTLDEAKKCEIMVWVDEKDIPTGISKGDRFRIGEIKDVTLRWKQEDKWNPASQKKEPRWVQKVSINARVAKIGSEYDGVDISDLNDIDTNLPWDEELPL